MINYGSFSGQFLPRTGVCHGRNRRDSQSVYPINMDVEMKSERYRHAAALSWLHCVQPVSSSSSKNCPGFVVPQLFLYACEYLCKQYKSECSCYFSLPIGCTLLCARRCTHMFVLYTSMQRYTCSVYTVGLRPSQTINIK